MPLAVLIGLIAAPALVLLFLRVNAALVFLSLCLGDVLLQFAGTDAVSLATGASTNAHVTGSTIKLAVLLAPAILTTLCMLKTVKGHKKIFNLLPAVGTGLLLALLVVPLLPSNLSVNITTQSIWTNTQSLQSAVVTASAVVCLCFIWFNRPKHGSEKEEKKHK